jgi:alkylation response protein AidB-like acyl-CoA dehydrogenase
MDFGLSPEQELLRDSLRGWLADELSIERVRETLDNDDAGAASRAAGDASAMQGLAEQGVLGVMLPEEHGGAGLGLLDAVVVATEMGRALTTVSYHSACVIAPLLLAGAGSAEQKSCWLPGVSSGKLLLSFAVGELEERDGALTGELRFVPDTATADAFVVVSGNGSAARAWLVERNAAGLQARNYQNIDTTRRLGELQLSDTPAEALAESDDLAGLVARVSDAARVVLAADSFGACERALEEAIEYASVREQFGRVVASFQAVKHMCAETFAELEPLRSLGWYAAFAWDEQRDDAARTVALLKAHSAEVSTRSVMTTTQVYGGMGFTWECNQQLWFKRVGYNRQALGGPVAERARALSL